jgi:hypothetical protein
MQKAYIRRIKSRAYPESSTVDYFFSTTLKDAWNWKFESVAQSFLPQSGVTLPLKGGGSYAIEDFEVEKPSPGLIVISCHAPFDLAALKHGEPAAAQSTTADTPSDPSAP